MTDCIPDSNILCTINCCKKFTAKKILPIHRKGQYSWKGFHGKISLQRRSFLPEAGWLFIISRIRYSRICGHKKCSRSPGFLSFPNKKSSAKTFSTVKIPIQKYLASKYFDEWVIFFGSTQLTTTYKCITYCWMLSVIRNCWLRKPAAHKRLIRFL